MLVNPERQMSDLQNVLDAGAHGDTDWQIFVRLAGSSRFSRQARYAPYRAAVRIGDGFDRAKFGF